MWNPFFKRSMKNCGNHTLDGMALINETDYHSDVALSSPPTEKTTTTKRHRLNSSTGALTSPSSSSITPADSLPTLPFDLVVEILSRVPVKSLMQLQSISKSWKSLISDPKFAKKHLRVSITRYHLVSPINPSRVPYITTYPLPSFFAEVTVSGTLVEYPLSLSTNRLDGIVGSCHGILCFALDERFALLWNPSIRKCAKLPSLDNPKREGSHTIYSFGYDHINRTYKVVALNCFESLRLFKTEVKVYTLGTNYWKKIQDFPSGVPYGGSGKFVSGTINWLAVNDSYTSLTIVSLGLEKEIYQVLLQPDYGAVNVVTKTLGVLRDCLCILAHINNFSHVWLMNEYGNKDSWGNVFRVPHMGDVRFCASTKALYVTEDDQVLLQYHAKLVVYNSRDGILKLMKPKTSMGGFLL